MQEVVAPFSISRFGSEGLDNSNDAPGQSAATVGPETLCFESPVISQAVHADIPFIATLHLEAFEGFFLTSMGVTFLSEMYRGFLEQETGILLVARSGERIVGFACGSTRPESFFSTLFTTRWWAFAGKAIPAVLRNPVSVLQKLWSAVFYRGDLPPTELPGALLSSIAVTSAGQGKGVANLLLRAFEAVAAQRSCGATYLTTDAIGNDRANAFYKKNGYSVDAQFLRSGRRLMNRYVKY